MAGGVPPAPRWSTSALPRALPVRRQGALRLRLWRMPARQSHQTALPPRAPPPRVRPWRRFLREARPAARGSEARTSAARAEPAAGMPQPGTLRPPRAAERAMVRMRRAMTTCQGSWAAATLAAGAPGRRLTRGLQRQPRASPIAARRRARERQGLNRMRWASPRSAAACTLAWALDKPWARPRTARGARSAGRAAGARGAARRTARSRPRAPAGGPAAMRARQASCPAARRRPAQRTAPGRPSARCWRRPRRPTRVRARCRAPAARPAARRAKASALQPWQAHRARKREGRPVPPTASGELRMVGGRPRHTTCATRASGRGLRRPRPPRRPTPRRRALQGPRPRGPPAAPPAPRCPRRRTSGRAPAGPGRAPAARATAAPTPRAHTTSSPPAAQLAPGRRPARPRRPVRALARRARAEHARQGLRNPP